MTCDGCGNENAYNLRMRLINKKTGYAPDEFMRTCKNDKDDDIVSVWECEHCSGSKVSITKYKDSLGNPVSFSDKQVGRFNYGTDCRFSSKSQYAEHLKRNHLAQKGTGDYNGREKGTSV